MEIGAIGGEMGVSRGTARKDAESIVDSFELTILGHFIGLLLSRTPMIFSLVW
jgi:hypothetical protein